MAPPMTRTGHAPPARPDEDCAQYPPAAKAGGTDGGNRMRFNMRFAALAMAGAATISALVGTAPASADQEQVSASGNTPCQFGRPFLKGLVTNGCGTLFGYGTGGAQAFLTNNGKVKL